MIDLRSDTVTLPTAEMRRRMYEAEVGDDSRDGDPTVNELQRLAAEVTGKEAALFVTSGTMGNLLACLAHCQPGQQVMMGPLHHTLVYERAGFARVAGLAARCIPHKGASYDLEDLNEAIQLASIQPGGAGLVWIENTFLLGGGLVLPLDELEKISNVCKEHMIPLHLDGARVFNAATYLGVNVSQITGYVDSVMFCLSKGLGAPFGSMLCGSAGFIEQARNHRQMIGGGMRQAGIMAAAGIYAIQHMSKRLQEDHDNARLLAEGLAQIVGLELDPSAVRTNIVIFELSSNKFTPSEFVEELGHSGLLVGGLWGKTMRMVTHHGIEEQDIVEALNIVERALA